MTKLSFIIPYYNGGKYIVECLKSIYNQDIPEAEYEVILVDDCSTDKDSIALVEQFAKEHSTLHIIRNECNLRCGGSRNAGLLQAKGEYVWFVDQDDYIAPNCLGHIVCLCKDNDLDILYFDYQDVSDDHSEDRKHGLVSQQSQISTGLDYISKDCNGDFWHAGYDTNVWHAMYRKEFMIDNGIFSPEVSYCEDLIVAQHAVISANRMMAIPEAYYCYRYNPTSVFHTEVGVKGRPLFDASIFAGVVLIKMSDMIPQKYIRLQETVRKGGVYRLNSFTKQLLKISREQRNAFFEMVCKYEKIVSDAMANLSSLNRWLLTHPRYVKCTPHIIYFIIRLLP